jgi:Leucine-rich repeat (LRR) protein
MGCLISVCYRNLDQNFIETIDPSSFKGLPALRNLRLDSNKLKVVPTQALAPLRLLELL